MSVCPECKSSTHTQKSTAILATKQSHIVLSFSWRQLKEFDEKNPLLKMFDESPPASPRILTQKELRDEHLSATGGCLGCLTLIIPVAVAYIIFWLENLLDFDIFYFTRPILPITYLFGLFGFCLVLSIPTYYIVKRRKRKAWDEADQQKLVQNQLEYDDYLVQHRAYMSQKTEYDNNTIIINNSIRMQRELLEQRIKNTWYCNKCGTLFWPGRESGGWEIVVE